MTPYPTTLPKEEVFTLIEIVRGGPTMIAARKAEAAKCGWMLLGYIFKMTLGDPTPLLTGEVASGDVGTMEGASVPMVVHGVSISGERYGNPAAVQELESLLHKHEVIEEQLAAAEPGATFSAEPLMINGRLIAWLIDMLMRQLLS